VNEVTSRLASRGVDLKTVQGRQLARRALEASQNPVYKPDADAIKQGGFDVVNTPEHHTSVKMAVDDHEAKSSESKKKVESGPPAPLPTEPLKRAEAKWKRVQANQDPETGAPLVDDAGAPRSASLMEQLSVGMEYARAMYNKFLGKEQSAAANGAAPGGPGGGPGGAPGAQPTLTPAERQAKSAEMRKAEGMKRLATFDGAKPTSNPEVFAMSFFWTPKVLIRFNDAQGSWQMRRDGPFSSGEASWRNAEDFPTGAITPSDVVAMKNMLAGFNGKEYVPQPSGAPTPAPNGAPNAAPTGNAAPGPAGAPTGAPEGERLPGGQEFTSGGRKFEMAFDGSGLRLRYKGVTYDVAANGRALRNFKALSQAGDGMSAKLEVNAGLLGMRQPDAALSGPDMAALLAALEAGGAGPKMSSVRISMNNKQPQLSGIPDASVKGKLQELGNVTKEGDNWICTSPLTLTPKS
jgi:hypothetical protein